MDLYIFLKIQVSAQKKSSKPCQGNEFLMNNIIMDNAKTSHALPILA